MRLTQSRDGHTRVKCCRRWCRLWLVQVVRDKSRCRRHQQRGQFFQPLIRVGFPFRDDLGQGRERTYTRRFPQVLSEVILLEQNQPVRQRSSSFGYMSISSGGRVRYPVLSVPEREGNQQGVVLVPESRCLSLRRRRPGLKSGWQTEEEEDTRGLTR